jgi:hypothetical protein
MRSNPRRLAGGVRDALGRPFFSCTLPQPTSRRHHGLPRSAASASSTGNRPPVSRVGSVRAVPQHTVLGRQPVLFSCLCGRSWLAAVRALSPRAARSNWRRLGYRSPLVDAPFLRPTRPAAATMGAVPARPPRRRATRLARRRRRSPCPPAPAQIGGGFDRLLFGPRSLARKLGLKVRDVALQGFDVRASRAVRSAESTGLRRRCPSAVAS